MPDLRSIPLRIKILCQYYCLQMSTSKMAGTPYGGFIYNFYRCLFGTILMRIFNKDISELRVELIEVFGERPDRSIKSNVKNLGPCVKVLVTDLRDRNCISD